MAMSWANGVVNSNFQRKGMEEVCKLTGLAIKKFERSSNAITYEVSFGELGWKTISICDKCSKKSPEDVLGISSAEFQRTMIGLITNGHFFPENYRRIHLESALSQTFEEICLDKVLKESFYPKSTKDRRHQFFKYLYSLQPFDCGAIEFDTKDIGFWGKNYYLNKDECVLVLRYFEDRGLIKISDFAQGNMEIRFTHQGLNEIDRIGLEYSQSNYGFVAMSFSDHTMPIRVAIKAAIKNAGYEPAVVDEQQAKNDQTIPDKIFSSIREARFCVADFTEHKNGVYFEAGYAVGLGIPVFYTCQEDDFHKNAHFDVKQLQQILYKTPDELQEKLEEKIKAWIR